MRILSLIFIVAISLTLQSCWEAAGTTAIGGLLVYKRQAVENFATDQDIESKINRGLFQNSELWERNHVIVSSVSGYVLVAGQVRTAALKQQVQTMAQDVKGIRRLYNEIVVGQPIGLFTQIKDSFITLVIKTKMMTSEKFDPSSVKVITDDGIVYLMGTVGPDEADKATDIASKAIGVKKVVKVFQYIT